MPFIITIEKFSNTYLEKTENSTIRGKHWEKKFNLNITKPIQNYVKKCQIAFKITHGFKRSGIISKQNRFEITVQGLLISFKCIL